ncbi:MAG: hypothetical protein QOJ07_2311, partial [Thermoleophilaceae bacterium]|nr:hypothetical protein [Thermoleophilaceae bacterium]
MAAEDANLTVDEEALLRAASLPGLPEPDPSASDRELRPRRRRIDYERRTAPRAALSSTAAEREAAGSLKKEVLAPFGLGVLVVVASLALLTAMAHRAGGSTFTYVGIGAIALTGVLLWWTGGILRGATQPALEQLKKGLREVEEGNYDVRLHRVGAREFGELAEGFNRMATIVSHQRERLKQLAATDPLTGLYNHRHFHERLRLEMQHAQDTNGSVAVVALDLDRFKRVNDEHGHARGDEA